MRRLRQKELKAALCGFFLACLGASAQAPVDIRLALVIGNAAYPAGNKLDNAVNDAHDMAEAMRAVGFSVIEVRDGSKAEMAGAVTRMQAALQGRKGVGLLYYAGHGLQYDWQNFMVPVDARLSAVADIPQATVDVATVLDAFRAAGNRLNVVILDACRDNPFDNQLATKGLAPVDAPPGTFMAFATAAGNVAEDGEGQRNGLYTRFLLQEIRKPDARLEDVFSRVKLQVQQASAGRQVPAESTSLDEEFSFDKGFADADAARRANRLDYYAAEKAEWDRIKSSSSHDDFYEFLRRYPRGFVSEIARFRIAQLQKPVLVAQARRDGITTLAAGTNRYAKGDEFTLVTTDLLTGVVQRELQRVTAASDERVEINGGSTVYNQMGGVLLDDTGAKDPPMLLVPADIAPGRKWRSSFQNQVAQFNIRTVVDFRTTGLEDLNLQGTVVKAFKVDMLGYAGPATVTGTVWIEPRTMRMVRWDRMVRMMGRAIGSRIEAVDYKASAARATPP